MASTLRMLWLLVLREVGFKVTLNGDDMITDEEKIEMMIFARDYWRRELSKKFDGDSWFAFDDHWDLNFWEEELPDRLVVWVTAYPYVDDHTDASRFVRLGQVATVRS